MKATDTYPLSPPVPEREALWVLRRAVASNPLPVALSSALSARATLARVLSS